MVTTKKSKGKSKGLRYYFFQHQYPAWLYTIAMGLFALGLYIWIKFFLIVPA